jgi:hypothetical protein
VAKFYKAMRAHICAKDYSGWQLKETVVVATQEDDVWWVGMFLTNAVHDQLFFHFKSKVANELIFLDYIELPISSLCDYYFVH